MGVTPLSVAGRETGTLTRPTRAAPPRPSASCSSSAPPLPPAHFSTPCSPPPVPLTTLALTIPGRGLPWPGRGLDSHKSSAKRAEPPSPPRRQEGEGAWERAGGRGGGQPAIMLIISYICPRQNKQPAPVFHNYSVLKQAARRARATPRGLRSSPQSHAALPGPALQGQSHGQSLGIQGNPFRCRTRPHQAAPTARPSE